MDDIEIRLHDNDILEDICKRNVHNSIEDGIIKNEGGHEKAVTIEKAHQLNSSLLEVREN